MLARSAHAERDQLLARIVRGGAPARERGDAESDAGTDVETDTDANGASDSETDAETDAESGWGENDEEPPGWESDDDSGRATGEGGLVYLADGALARTFGELGDADGDRTLYVCAYALSRECRHPFLKFAVRDADGAVGFPARPFRCPVFSAPAAAAEHGADAYVGDAADDAESQAHVFFMNSCVEILMSVIPAHDVLTPEMLEGMYRGFAEGPAEPAALFAFFDCGALADPRRAADLPAGMRWAVASRLLKGGARVDPAAAALFAARPALAQLQTARGLRNALAPVELYPCARATPDDPYVSLYDATDAARVLSLARAPAEALPFFGRAHVFSTEPIAPVGEGRVVRYAGFATAPMYVVKDALENLDEAELEAFADRAEAAGADAVYFFLRGRQHWAIKSPDNFARI